MKRLILTLVILLLLVLPLGTALADPLADTVVAEGEVINNDIIVFDGDLEIQQGAVVHGDVIVFNGNAQIAGTIDGDLVLFNGDLNAAEGAAIRGECVLLNGSVAAGSILGCTAVEGEAFTGFLQKLPVIPPLPTIPAIPPVPTVPPLPEVPAAPESPVAPAKPAVPAPPAVVERNERTSLGFAANMARSFGTSFLLALVAAAVALLFPAHLQQVTDTVRRKPLASGAVGLLTSVAVPSVVVLLLIVSAILTLICIGLLGFPLALFILLALGAAGVMGWIAVGTWLGQRFFQRKGRSLAMIAALGTFVLTFLLHMLNLIPIMIGESILVTFIGLIGLGAVALTQFGTKPYPRGGEGEIMTSNAEKVAAVLETLPLKED
jgi:hypothetical protein